MRLKVFFFIFFNILNFTFAQSSEKIVKAVFIERISPFVVWPEESGIDNKNEPFIIGCWSGVSFGDVLRDVYNTKAILSKNVIIKDVRKFEDIKGCHVLYLPQIHAAVLNEIVRFSYHYPVLLISDTPGYAEKGVHINLLVKNDNLAFEINEESVKEAGIRLSHLLLELATIVGNR